MNLNGGDDNPSCYLHPNKLTVGVCSLCLKEKLLILASKQEEHQHNSFRTQKKKIATVAGVIQRILRLSSFPTHFDLHRPKQEHDNSSTAHDSSILSLKDSFISTKLDGGECTRKKDESLMEHGKQMAVLRWRKHIRYIFKRARWTWPNKKTRKCHVGVGLEG